MQTKKSNKELINCFKDYIDIADASYAMLHNVLRMKEMDLMSFIINELSYKNT